MDGTGNGIPLSVTSSADNNRHVVEVDNNTICYLDGQSKGTLTAGHSWTSNKYFYLFKFNATSGFNAMQLRIYEFKAPGCHLIPAMRDADSVVGMYDVEQNVFRTNQGTGTFTYG